MKILHGRRARAGAARKRGAALLLSLLLLLILVAIVIQINVSTGTDARVARNDVTITTMDLAAESALLQVLETLKADGEAAAGTAGAPGGASAAGAGAATGGAADPAAGAPGASQQPCDSRRDEWASPQRTEINGIRLRIFVQDENSKFNVLNMLNPDEKEAEAAFERVVRILDACREGTNYDIDQRTAEEMAKAWLDALTKRKTTRLPRAKLLTDDEKDDDRTMPMSLREVMPLTPFEDHHFKDFRDEDGHVVHSIGAFLTVWSSLQTTPSSATASGTGGGANTGGAGNTGGSSGTNSGTSSKSGSTGSTGSSSSAKSGTTGTSGGTGGTAGGSGGTSGGSSASGASGTQGGGTSGATAGGGASSTGSSGGHVETSYGYGVNVNTAPVAVLKSLVDSRLVSGRFWDKLIEYRNLEDEEEKKKDEEARSSSDSTPEEEQLDEYGQPILKRNIFETLQELSEVDGYGDLPTENQAKLQQLLGTQSEVFSIYIVARKFTGSEASADFGLSPAEQRKREEVGGDSITRVIHAVYWRQGGGEDIQLVPIVRWEVLDYLPYEVLDFPPEDR